MMRLVEFKAYTNVPHGEWPGGVWDAGERDALDDDFAAFVIAAGWARDPITGESHEPDLTPIDLHVPNVIAGVG